MNTIQKLHTFRAQASDAAVATNYISNAIVDHARDKDCSVVSISHAMIQQGKWVIVTALVVFEQTV